MEINLSEKVKEIIAGVLLIILPLIVIGIGTFTGINNAWYYILSVVWFCMGVIFFYSIY